MACLIIKVEIGDEKLNDFIFICFRFLRFDMTPLKSDFIYCIYIHKPWAIKDLQPIHDLQLTISV